MKLNKDPHTHICIHRLMRIATVPYASNYIKTRKLSIDLQLSRKRLKHIKPYNTLGLIRIEC